jgi:hypothetical protein
MSEKRKLLRKNKMAGKKPEDANTRVGKGGREKGAKRFEMLRKKERLKKKKERRGSSIKIKTF